MLTIEQAHEQVLTHAGRLAPQTMALTSAALGLVLAEDVVSDLDMPPFDKALMDGYAVRSADILAGKDTFVVVEEILAGHTPTKQVESGQAARIMTRAAMPQGADAVIMLERTNTVEGNRVLIEERGVKTSQNVLPRAKEMGRGDVVLKAGAILRPQEFGLLAAVGKMAVKVYPSPIVAVLSTGDEVVEPFMHPGPGHIRNSNAYMLTAQIVRAGGTPRYLGIARDAPEHLRPLIAEGLKADMLVITGGVSAGKADYVSVVLQELAVQSIFHKIKMKPGKPLFFGKKGQCLIFGLPGNPVSALVGFELFVRSAIQRLMGFLDPGPRMIQAKLATPFDYTSDRPTYHPALLSGSAGRREVTLVPWFGSADLRAISAANVFALLPPEQNRYAQGEVVQVLLVE